MMATWRQWAGVLVLVSAAGLALAGASGSALSQVQQGPPSLEQLLPSGEASASGRIVQMFGLITVLSLAPGILVMVTCFTRFIVVLSFLRSGLGLPTTPANIVLVSLALFMTFHVMTPTLDKAWRDGVEPLNRGEITEQVALERIAAPFREFMLSQVRDRDVELFISVARANAPGAQLQDATSPEDLGLRLLIPAFMISELRRAFEIGFLILLPFLVIDLVVATLIMSMGMMMLPPTVISLPFKVLFFVLIDGWSLLAGGLMRSVG
jgi:flagellar biosynthetic protein FliP